MTGNLKSVLLATALVAVAGCGDGSKKDGAAPAAGGDSKGAAPAASGGAKYDASKSTASVKFTVKWAGAKPTVVYKQISGDDFCKAAHTTPVADEKFVVNADGTLPYAFVWASDGPQKGMTGFPAPAAVTLDQHGCMYVPHVFGLRAGQSFTIVNSDGTKHNVHSHPQTNKDFNVQQDKDQKNEFKWDSKERAIPFQCDIHSWMQAFAFVVDHPFFGATDDKGAVEIKGLPAGTYKFKAWHESFSASAKELAADIEVTVKDGESVTKEVELKEVPK